MRHSKNYLKKCSRQGKQSQKAQENNRLESALNHEPIRSIESDLILEINTFNPRNGAENNLKIVHEVCNGNDRYSVYLNGDRWKKQFSRTGFCNWLFNKIDSVRVDWS